MSLYQLLSLAYGKHCRVSLEQNLISGGPEWLGSSGFDIQATFPDGFPIYTRQQLTNGDAPRLQILIQNMLADRFKLVLRRTTKEVPIYNLVLMNMGSVKLSQDQNPPPGVPPTRGWGIRLSPSQETVTIHATSVPLSSIIDGIQGLLGRAVVDKTGLKGLIDIPEQTFDIGPGLTAPSTWLPDVLRKVGLSLESTKGPVEALIIDQVEKPSEN